MRVKIFDTKTKAKEILPNKEPKLLLVDDKEVCLVRQGDHISAFENACPHMGEHLHRGNSNHYNEIICPLHAYRFNMTTGRETNQRCKDLKIFEVIDTDEGIFLEC